MKNLIFDSSTLHSFAHLVVLLPSWAGGGQVEHANAGWGDMIQIVVEPHYRGAGGNERDSIRTNMAESADNSTKKTLALGYTVHKRTPVDERGRHIARVLAHVAQCVVCLEELRFGSRELGRRRVLE